MDDSTLSAVREHVDRGRHAYRNRAIGAYAAALGVLAIVALVSGVEFYVQGPMVLVVILALTGAGFHIWYRRVSWATHPVLLALANAPADIVAAEVLGAQGRAALLDERQVEIRTERAAILLTVKRDTLPGLGDALAAHCPRARLRGFEPSSD